MVSVFGLVLFIQIRVDGAEANGDVPLDGVAFSIFNRVTRVAHFRIFGVRKFFTYTVSKRTRMFVL